MAPSSRQIFIWSLPTLFLLSFLWYKRKKSALQSDPGGTVEKSKRVDLGTTPKSSKQKSIAVQKETVVLKVVEENVQCNIVTSVESENPYNSLSLAEELLASSVSSPEETGCIGEHLILRETERIQESAILSIFETANSAVGSDLECTDKISQVELITEEALPEASTTTLVNVNFSAPAEIQVKLATEAEVTLPKVIEGAAAVEEEKKLTLDESDCNNPSEEKQGSLGPCVLKSSWAAECELELDEKKPGDEKIVAGAAESGSPSKGEMARELSSDVSLKGDSPVEESCSTRNESVEDSLLESKLASLEINDSETKQLAITNKVLVVKETNGERDSANHSPSEVMLGSPSMSNYSDVQSEGSSDSGKGCSDVATPPSRTPISGGSVAGDAPPATSIYEFVLPQLLVGRLIGRHGLFVHQIKTKTHASILIKRHPETHKLKICAIEGSQLDIENALEMIRQKFPIKRYPNVTLDQVSFLSPSTTYPPVPDSFQLQLIEGVNNDVILSSLVTPGHFFLQQPTHPTYPALNRLNLCMNYCYNDSAAPALPSPIEASVICVAPTMGGWYRAQVVSSDAETGTSDVKFIDYGGYQTVENALLRQIRSDFIALPFQAAECYLANIKPKDGVWPYEALAFVEELTHGQVLQAQIYGYANDGIPVVFLFSIQGSQVLVVNRELVDRGYAEWDEPTEDPAEVAAPEEASAPASIPATVTA